MDAGDSCVNALMRKLGVSNRTVFRLKAENEVLKKMEKAVRRAITEGFYHHHHNELIGIVGELDAARRRP